MDKAAWQYGHKNQIILDGTFGVCSLCVLMLIAIGHNKENKGIVLAFLIFSAPTGNQATNAGYNMDILTELLDSWAAHLQKHPVTKETFTPYVAITDTDPKEWAALAKTWRSIILLLCRFHVWQYWTNK